MFNQIRLIGRLGQNAEAKNAQANKEYVILRHRTHEVGRTTRLCRQA